MADLFTLKELLIKINERILNNFTIFALTPVLKAVNIVFVFNTLYNDMLKKGEERIESDQHD